VGPRAVLDAVVKRKIPSPRRKSNPKTPNLIQTLISVPGYFLQSHVTSLTKLQTYSPYPLVTARPTEINTSNALSANFINTSLKTFSIQTNDDQF
jgi:hypothetical protein